MSFNFTVWGHTIDKDAEAFVVKEAKKFVELVRPYVHPDTELASSGSWTYHNGGSVDANHPPVEGDTLTGTDETAEEAAEPVQSEPPKVDMSTAVYPNMTHVDSTVTTTTNEGTNAAG